MPHQWQLPDFDTWNMVTGINVWGSWVKAIWEFFVFTIFATLKSLKEFQNEWLKNFNSEYATEGDDDVLMLTGVWILQANVFV